MIGGYTDPQTLLQYDMDIKNNASNSNIPSSIKTGSGIQKLMEGIHTHRDRKVIA
jgi:hypothetical protein